MLVMCKQDGMKRCRKLDLMMSIDEMAEGNSSNKNKFCSINIWGGGTMKRLKTKPKSPKGAGGGS